MLFDFSSSVPSGVTVARAANTATTINSSGNIVTVNADLGRIDYDPAALTSRGLLIEESRTNIINQSETLTHVIWTQNNSTVSADFATAPSGAVTAEKWIEAVGSGGHAIQQFFTKAASATPYSYTWYVKYAGRQNSFLSVYDGPGTSFTQTSFNSNTGVLVAGPSLAGTYTNASTSITAHNNSWYRFGVSFTSNTDTAQTSVFGASSDAGAEVYTGDGTSSLYLWGLSAEAGAFPTSYIATTSSVTRNADDVTIATSSITNWSATAGDLHVWGRTGPITTQQQQSVLTGDDGTTNNRISVIRNTSQAIHVLFVSGGVTQADLNLGTVAANTNFDIYASWAANAFSAQLNGGTAVTDSAGTVPTVTTWRVGKALSGEYLNGWVNKLEFALTTQPTVSVTDTSVLSITDASTKLALQMIRPDADVAAGSWVTDTGATSNLYLALNEVDPDDATYIASEHSPSASAVIIGLSDPADALGVGNGIVRFRYKRGGTGVINLTVRLMEGTTQIASWTYNNILISVVETHAVITAGEVASIVDRTALRLKFEATAA